tara:strand:+ start:154 stop:420 length:267 start_codon:yes stop_codon:yes gene_type:complete
VSDGFDLKKFFEGEDYSDDPRFKDMILTWNKAQDIIGIKQSLWVLRITMGWKKSLCVMNPDLYPKLTRLLREKYHELVKSGRIDPKKN